MNARFFVNTLLVLLFPALLHAKELSEKDSGKSVSLSAGNGISLKLAGNPTTGYGWEIAEIDRSILVSAPSPQYTPDSALTGAGGNYNFSFIGIKPGKSAVRLVYRRSWEKDVAPVKTVNLKITVLPAETGIAVATYRSASKKSVTAFFDTAKKQVTVILPEGRTVTLTEAMSASGARYANDSESFWEHQGTGRFFTGETVVFEGAVEVPQK